MEKIETDDEIRKINKKLSKIERMLESLLDGESNREDWEIQLVGIDDGLTISLNGHPIYEYTGVADDPINPPISIRVYDKIYKQLANSHANHPTHPEFAKAAKVADAIKAGEKLRLKFTIRNTGIGPDHATDSNMMYRFHILWKGHVVLRGEHKNFGQQPDGHTEEIEYEISHSSHVDSGVLQLIKRV